MNYTYKGLIKKDNIIINLFHCVHSNLYKQVEQIFASGVNVDTVDAYGNTALSISCKTNNKIMAKICLYWGANLNHKDIYGYTPLMHCFASKHNDLGHYIIRKKGIQYHPQNNASSSYAYFYC